MSRLGLPKDAPPLPEGYHYSQIMSPDSGIRFDVCFRGARIFIVAIEAYSHTDYWEKQKRYAARPMRDPAKGPFMYPVEWIEYPDLPTLVTSMITKHRLGVI